MMTVAMIFYRMKLFLPPKVLRFVEDHRLNISLDSRAEEVFLCCLIFNTAKEKVMMLRFCLKIVISICQKYRSNIFLKNHFLYTSPLQSGKEPALLEVLNLLTT